MPEVNPISPDAHSLFSSSLVISSACFQEQTCVAFENESQGFREAVWSWVFLVQKFGQLEFSISRTAVSQ